MKTLAAGLFISFAVFISVMAITYVKSAPLWHVHAHQCMPHCTMNCDLNLNQE